MKKIAIVMLTYNKLNEATKPCLESLYKFTDAELFDLVIVDNGSSDGTVEFLNEFVAGHSNARVILNGENLGYSKGNNIGIKSVLDKDYEYIGLLNNDILFTPNWLNNTLDAFKSGDNIGMISPRNNEKCKLTSENYLLGYEKYLAKFKDALKYVVTPFFSCVIIKKEVFKKIGLLDEDYSPAFYEDNDFSFRAMYAGYFLCYANNAFIFHNHSTTSKSIPSDVMQRNKELFFKKHPLGKYIWQHKRTNILKDIRRYIKESFE